MLHYTQPNYMASNIIQQEHYVRVECADGWERTLYIDYYYDTTYPCICARDADGRPYNLDSENGDGRTLRIDGRMDLLNKDEALRRTKCWIFPRL